MLRRALYRLFGELLRRGPAAPGREPRAPLPEALAGRLRAIPQSEVLCRDVDLSWPELARGELPPGRTRALRAHADGCGRCARTLAVLAGAATEPPRPLPGRLFFRLNAVPRQTAPAPLPFLLRDGRRMVAAAALGAVVLATAADGDPLAVAARAVEATSVQAKEAGPELYRPLQGAWRWGAWRWGAWRWAETGAGKMAHSLAASWQQEVGRRREQAAALTEAAQQRSDELRTEVERRAEELKRKIPPGFGGRTRPEGPDSPDDETRRDGEP